MNGTTVKIQCWKGAPRYFACCPCTNPALGSGFSADLVTLTLRTIGEDRLLEFVNVEYRLNGTNPIKLADYYSDLDRLDLTIIPMLFNYLVAESKYQDYLFRSVRTPNYVVIFNQPNELQYLNVLSLFHQYSYVLGIVAYLMIILSLSFALRGSKRSYLDLAYQISFQQKNTKKWRSKGWKPVLLITLWSLCSGHVVILLKSVVVKNSEPRLTVKLPFESLSEFAAHPQATQFTFVDSQEWPVCIGDPDRIGEWTKALCPPFINRIQVVSSISESLQHINKNPGTFTINSIDAMTGTESLRNLSVAELSDLPAAYLPLMSFLRIDHKPRSERDAQRRLKLTYSKFLAKLDETGVLSKMLKDYGIVMDTSQVKSRTITAEYKPTPVRNLRMAFELLVVGLACAVLAFLWECMDLDLLLLFNLP